jgi:FG-GAP repeat
VSRHAGHLQIQVDDRGAEYPVRVDPYVQQAQLTSSDGAADDEFWLTVAVSGDTAVVGAPGHKVGGNAAQGTAYVFVRPAAGWAHAVQTAELTASDGAPGDLLGNAVAISDDTIVAGSFHTVGANIGQGAAYVYTSPPPAGRTLPRPPS